MIRTSFIPLLSGVVLLGDPLFWVQISGICTGTHRDTNPAAVQQKLHSWTCSALRGWGSCSTLAGAAVSMARKNTPDMQNVGDRELPVKNGGIPTDFGVSYKV